MRAVGIGIVAVASFGLGYGVGYDEGFEARDTFPTAIECTWPDGTKERAREVISHGEDGTDVRCVYRRPSGRRLGRKIGFRGIACGSP